MLSICIPVFNFEVDTLVNDLLAQAKALNMDFEILLWDDGSTASYRNKNQHLKDLDSRIKYHELAENVGRSKIRNQLAAAAQYEWLLFLDCDAALVDDSFLARYQATFDQHAHPAVVCGGRIYPAQPTDPALQLHWKYGTHKESQPAIHRLKSPNASFMTNNFLVSKSIFKRIQFNETLHGYGHEDTLFGWDLKSNQILIDHIENPVCHIGLVSTAVFLAKTKEGVDNLAKLYHLLGEERSWYEDIKLLKTHLTLEKWRLSSFVYALLRASQTGIRRQLFIANPSLRLFDLYKLYLLTAAKRKLEQHL